MDTKLYLFRRLNDTAPHWHSIGGHHERLSLNLIDLVGYAGRNCADRTPYHCYNATGYETDLAHLPIPAIDQKKEYETIAEAKAAGEAYAMRWIEAAGKAPVIWTACHTGVHWQANADGVHVGSYYFSAGTLPMPDGTPWHKGFRVWFGGTYFTIDFDDPAAARAEVERTWRHWLSVAKSLLQSNK